MAKLVSKVYGDALFEVGLEKARLGELESEVLAVKHILLQNPEFDQLMLHPKIDNDAKIKSMESVFKGRISDDCLGLLVIVVTKGRYKELPRIFDYFITRVKEYEKIGIAHVTSAVPLKDDWKKKIEAKLLETTDYVKMEMEFHVDESLIGGLIIRIGDRVVDSSIKSHLVDLTGKLTRISLEA
ncbi:ATP synthase F1 subunit delta [Robinsoniella peoriensis]